MLAAVTSGITQFLFLIVNHLILVAAFTLETKIFSTIYI